MVREIPGKYSYMCSFFQHKGYKKQQAGLEEAVHDKVAFFRLFFSFSQCTGHVQVNFFLNDKKGWCACSVCPMLDTPISNDVCPMLDTPMSNDVPMLDTPMSNDVCPMLDTPMSNDVCPMLDTPMSNDVCPMLDTPMSNDVQTCQSMPML